MWRFLIGLCLVCVLGDMVCQPKGKRTDCNKMNQYDCEQQGCCWDSNPSVPHDAYCFIKRIIQNAADQWKGRIVVLDHRLNVLRMIVVGYLQRIILRTVFLIMVNRQRNPR
eukprot:UN26466